MKTLIVENLEPSRLGELATVGRFFEGQSDLFLVGAEVDVVPGSFRQAWAARESCGANLVDELAAWIGKEGYQVILLSSSTLGGGLAGPLAEALGAVVISEVVGLSVQDGQIILEKPVYGGKAISRYLVKAFPLILTVRRKYFEKDPLDGSTPVTRLDFGQPRVRVLGEKEEKTEGIPLEDAEIIVTGGRGLGGAENFRLLEEMADLLKGAVGASRGAVDEGWAPQTMQIGQTGKIVAPKIYLAVGVSGASQHLAGIANAKCVVGVNKDEEAGIYNRAQFGIVTDYRKIVPEIIKALKESL